jgi:hypothetical protein
MPVNVTITAEELKELLAERDAARALREEQEALRGTLRLVTAERDLAEERLRAYRHELFGAKSEARDSDQPSLFNEAEMLGASSTPAQEVRDHRSRRRVRLRAARAAQHRAAGWDRVACDGPASCAYVQRPSILEYLLVEFGVEISEQLDVIPEQLRVIQHQRVKYACINRHYFFYHYHAYRACFFWSYTTPLRQ